MKIPTPRDALRALDHEVHHMFMKAGIDKIPEGRRAKLSYGLTMIGASLVGGGVAPSVYQLTGSKVPSFLLGFTNMMVAIPNGVQCRQVMKGTSSDQNTDTKDYFVEAVKSWNRKVRPIYAVIGAYFACRVGFDILDAAFTDTVFNYVALSNKGFIGGGSAAVAVGLYINDVDPKISERSSKLQDVFDTITGKNLEPALEPVPINNYQSLDDAVT